jgi:RNA-binding protein
LKGFQKKYLKGLAHRMKPVVFIGQKGMTGSVVSAINGALDTHELIKIRFLDFKEKEQKTRVVADIEKAVGCEIVSRIGHVLTVYRQHDDPEKRGITVPQRAPKRP